MELPIKISVAVAAYNAADYLREAIDSVLAQTVQPLEIVVVDDGSKDHTRQVCESFGDRVRYLYQENDGTAGIGARWKSIQESQSEWIALLDHDDRWRPEKLERQIDALKQFPDAGLVLTRYATIGPVGEDLTSAESIPPSGRLIRRESHEALHHLLQSNPYCPSSALVLKRALIEDGPPSPTSCGDWSDWFRISRNFPMLVVDEYLTEYRTTPEQFCSNKDHLATRLSETLQQQKVHLFPGCADCRKAFRAGEAHVAHHFAVAARTYLDQYHAAAQAGDVSRARSLLKQAIRAAPMEVLRPRRFAAVSKNYALGMLRK
jgi:glycosyltransferase involved in cell wall biosynthesis